MEPIPRTEAKRLGLPRYFTGEACIRGHITERRTRDRMCMGCRKVYRVKYTRANPDLRKKAARKYRENSPRPSLHGALRQGLRKHPTDNPTTINELVELYLNQKGLCAITGIKMIWAKQSKGAAYPLSMSIDRIDQNRSYEKGNCRLVCQCINMFRCRMSDQQMFSVAKLLVNNLTESYGNSSDEWLNSRIKRKIRREYL